MDYPCREIWRVLRGGGRVKVTRGAIRQSWSVLLLEGRGEAFLCSFGAGKNQREVTTNVYG